VPVRVLSSPRSRSWVRRILRRFRNRGTRLGGGYLRRFVSMLMKVLGRRQPATATTAAISFSPAPGPQLVVRLVPIGPRRVSKPIGPGWSTGVTATRGANGEPLGRADFTNRGGN
jgi:hypothetical protein